MLSLYLAQPSWLHRVPAGAKLLALLLASLLLLPAKDLWVLGMAVLVALACFLSLRRAGRQRLGHLITSLGPMLIVLGVFQVLAMAVTHGWELGFSLGLQAAGTTLARLLALILLADLVTLSTPTQDLVAALQPILRPLRIFGLSDQRLSLSIGIMLRWVSLLQAEWSRTRTAFAARGCARPRMRITGPLMHRSAQTAQQMSEALAARRTTAR
jgi:biotin transport system permease protein